ncbi:hypothetical protein CONPUDRAFT_118457 [Coniophora puteana RWD-64-598 SS2]|uniref:NAD(P)-binding domain-containing protein n=1 Tax=Coniophora puteana (strain RWD-64-598) TaxID=741705 RepID=A0A5M3N2D6_CONPW|nr:uncharacterized protein CONPUDRAFT_118457 [Coniophora puteana RWD-64-598 SS2]EIW85550.1 hypothetical protein CONPUDRAFT_118457 [Coniophora puteana RWD-64-598 SS2]
MSKVLAIGASRNIGYYSSLRLLDLGYTVTFLLRKPECFDHDAAITRFVKDGKARLVKGDALVKSDVERAWAEAAKGGDDLAVDFMLFTVGGTPSFKLTKGFIIEPPNLVTQSLLNVLETLPADSPDVRIITISSIGLTRESHNALPRALKPVYSYTLTAPHKDKCGAEEVLAHAAGWTWDVRDSAGEEILGTSWADRVPEPASLKRLVVIRPALLTDGECAADKPPKRAGKEAYRVKEGDVNGSWTISRRDVAHFIVEKVAKNWDEWEGKRVSIAY